MSEQPELMPVAETAALPEKPKRRTYSYDQVRKMEDGLRERKDELQAGFDGGTVTIRGVAEELDVCEGRAKSLLETVGVRLRKPEGYRAWGQDDGDFVTALGKEVFGLEGRVRMLESGGEAAAQSIKAILGLVDALEGKVKDQEARLVRTCDRVLKLEKVAHEPVTIPLGQLVARIEALEKGDTEVASMMRALRGADTMSAEEFARVAAGFEALGEPLRGDQATGVADGRAVGIAGAAEDEFPGNRKGPGRDFVPGL